MPTGRKLCPDVVRDITEFMTEPVKEIMHETVNVAKKEALGDEQFQDTDLGGNQGLTNTAPADLTEDDVMKIVLPNQCQAMGKKTSKKRGRKQINIRQPGRSVPNTRDGF